MITELSIFPQVIYSEGQGHVGTRKWALDRIDEVDGFVSMVAASHWPGRKDSIPVDIQWGPMDEKVVIKRDAETNPRTVETLGQLPKYGKILVVARYALHRIQNCWPAYLGPKPYHPPNTTINIRSKGAGQNILASPAGMRSMSPDLLLCGEGTESPSAGFFGRVVLPIAEYHITCGLLTKGQVEDIFEQKHWDTYLGRVNTVAVKATVAGDLLKNEFLAAPHGTLLFEGYELREMFACSHTAPMRYSLTASFKRRVILDNNSSESAHGLPLLDSSNIPVGWNHDYVNVHDGADPSKRWDWTFISIFQGSKCVPRYSDTVFKNLFSDTEEEYQDTINPGWDECDSEDEDPTEIDDCAFTCSPGFTP